ncbi:MAG: hypothetical protein ACJ0K4_07080 [Verrucomicrobiales bacterium]
MVALTVHGYGTRTLRADGVTGQILSSSKSRAQRPAPMSIR